MGLRDCIIPTFDVLTAEQIDKINEHSYLVKHRKDEVLFRQNTPVSHFMYIKTGLVKLYREAENERRIILKITASEHFIGLLNAFYDTRYQFSSSLLINSDVVYCDLKIMNEVLKENGEYATCLMKIMSKEALGLLNNMINVSQKQVPGRLAEVLLFFAQKIYMSNSYLLPVSRQELAELTSSTKESISRTLTEFKNDRIIEIDDRKIVLKSVQLLEILSKMG